MIHPDHYDRHERYPHLVLVTVEEDSMGSYHVYPITKDGNLVTDERDQAPIFLQFESSKELIKLELTFLPPMTDTAEDAFDSLERGWKIDAYLHEDLVTAYLETNNL